MEKIVDSEIMWRPSDDMLENCKLTAFMRRLGLADFEALNKFAEDKPEAFWNELIKEVDFVEERDGRLFAFEFTYGASRKRVPALWSKTYPGSQVEVITPENVHRFLAAGE